MSPLLILLAIACYFALLFIVAHIFDMDSPRILRISQSPLVYSLSLAVYCTSWTYYGSVGWAANSGLSFLAVYIGPTIIICLWPFILRRIVTIKEGYRITSIADFISARYNKSQAIAALVTIMALIGCMPYIALQLEAIKSTFTLLVKSEASPGTWLFDHFGLLMVLLLTFFTVIFGARKLDPTERHRGIMTAIALESVVKLVAFTTCGIYVCSLLLAGGTEGLRDLISNPDALKVFRLTDDEHGYTTWTTLLILSMSAILFLPRQFHVAVIENSSPTHIASAVWQFPLYMFLINLFVIPITLYGITSGLPVTSADTYVLNIPVTRGNDWLALFVFLGGFSAAMSMIIVSAMTVSTMVVNHLLLPLFNYLPMLAPMRRLLLGWRWVTILAILTTGYWFQIELGSSYALVNMGLISFAAVLQFAPATLGAVLWSGGNKHGAFTGLAAGFAVWFYTLLLPSFIRSGLFSMTILDAGPWGIALLRPEQLFGLTILSPLSHTVFWSLLFNIGTFVLISLLKGTSEDELKIARDFVSLENTRPTILTGRVGDDSIAIKDKNVAVLSVLNEYFPPEKSESIISECLNKLSLADKRLISIIEFAEVHRCIEIFLAGSIGTAMAHRAMGREDIFNRLEKARLSAALGEILARLKVSPLELAQKIDLYREREQLLTSRSEKLEARIREKEEELETRIQAEKHLSRNHEKLEQAVRLRTAEIVENQAFLQEVLENIQAAVILIDRESRELLDCNTIAERLLGYDKHILTEDRQALTATRILEQETDGRLQNRELHVVSRDNRSIPVLRNVIQVVYKGVMAEAIILFDLTEHKKLEHRVEMAHKLQSIGQLAAGIAHEINTPIQYIGSNIGFLADSFQQLFETNNLYKALMDRARSGEDITREMAEVSHHIEELDLQFLLEEIPHAVNESLSGINQVSAIIKAMEQYSRPEQDIPMKVDINRALEQMAMITRSEWKHVAELELNLDRGNPRITCIPSLVNQVFLNMVINSARAAGEQMARDGRKGRIAITSRAEASEVAVSFSDTSKAPEASSVKELIDIYRTSNSNTGDAGRYLSIAYSLVSDKLDGTINLSRATGSSTVFIVRLPVNATGATPEA